MLADGSFQQKFQLPTITTLCNEHCNNKVLQEETPTAFELAINFSDIVDESLKELTDPGHSIFTGKR